MPYYPYLRWNACVHPTSASLQLSKAHTKVERKHPHKKHN